MITPFTRRIQTVFARSLLGWGAALCAALMPALRAQQAEYRGRLGLLDAEHTTAEGNNYSFVEKLTESGWAVGSSGPDMGGSSSWLASVSGGTVRIGLLDAEHTFEEGYRDSTVLELTESGWASGFSYRSGILGGQSAWLANASGTLRVGYIDAEHTSADGERDSGVFGLTENGWAMGRSTQFTAFDHLGQTAWLANTTGTMILAGFYDAAHTYESVLHHSTVESLTESGWARGQSASFNEFNAGISAWLASTSGTTVRIGLTDAAHTNGGGLDSSYTENLTESGWVSGFSHRYDHDDERGQSAWLANVSGTVRVGLFDAEHTGADGEQFSAVDELAESGWALGHSTVRAGTTSAGASGSQTRRARCA